MLSLHFDILSLVFQAFTCHKARKFVTTFTLVSVIIIGVVVCKWYICSDGISNLNHIESRDGVVSEYELEKLLKEMVDLWHCLEGVRKTIEYLSEDALCPDIQTGYLPNVSWKHYNCFNIFCYYWS